MENSHQEEEEFEDIFAEDDTEESTPKNGDDSEQVSDEVFLRQWNKLTGRNDKSIESVKKQEAEARKLASQIGRKKVETPTQEKPEIHPVMRNLYFRENPEAQIIWETVEAEAKNLGKDPFELYEGSSYLRGEAKAKFEMRKAEEEAKLKVDKPTAGSGDSSIDVSAVKAEDVSKLKPSEKIAWLRAQAMKERLES